MFFNCYVLNYLSTTCYRVEITHFLIEFIIDKCKIAKNVCIQFNLPNGYEYLSGMSMGRLYGGMVLLYPTHTLSIAIFK
jgi:hypothetical protein